MTLCINIATRELMMIGILYTDRQLIGVNVEVYKQIVNELWPIKIIDTKSIIMTDGNIYDVTDDKLLLITELETIASAISDHINTGTVITDIKNNDIKIIQADANIMLLAYNNCYYYYNYNDKYIHYISKSVDISTPVIVHNTNIVAFINKCDHNKLILYDVVTKTRFKCDTEVNIILYINTSSNSITLYYSKNTTIICKNFRYTHDFPKLKICDSFEHNFNVAFHNYNYYIDTHMYYDNATFIFYFIDGNNKLNKINLRRFLDANIPAHVIYDNYLFKDFRSNYNSRSIYLQTVDNVIIYHDIISNEFIVVSSNCTFCVDSRKTKKAIQ